TTGTLYTVQGKVYYSEGAAEDATVTLRVVKSDSPADTSLPLTTTVGSDSVWQINLANLHATDGSSFSHAENDILLLEFDGAEKGFEQYDTVRASDSASPMTIRTIKLVPYVEYDMELKTGLNLIGLPLKLFDGEPTDAHAFLNLIQGGAPSMSRYVTSTGTQETITRSVDGSYIGASNFDLEVEEGYFVQVKSKTTVQLKGRVYTESVPVINFPGAGLYFVSRPGQDKDLFISWDALQILQNVANVSIVYRFDPSLQRYEQYFPSGTGYAGTNFGIDVGQGYIFNLTGASSWDPNTLGALLASDGGGASSSQGVERVIVLDIEQRELGVSPGSFSVVVSNVTSAAAVVSWFKGGGELGQLRVSLADGSKERILGPVVDGVIGGMGYVEITGLKPATEYVYRIEDSNGRLLAEQAEGTFTTARVGVGLVPYTLFGRLVDVRGVSLGGLLVLVKLRDETTGKESGYISAVSDKDGYWVVNLANLKERYSGVPYRWREGDEVELTIIGGTYRSVYHSRVRSGSPHNIALDLQQPGLLEEEAQKKRAVSMSLPKAYSLAQNFPNPFNPSTTINFSLPEQAGKVEVRLEVFNLRGQLVKTLLNRTLEPGVYQVQWDGTAGDGRQVPSGVYFYRLRTPQFKATRKMVILK
ncbi:MAG: hypothetical protein DRG82_17135, partial [Deltaproteobacteria bacterium]